jgi:RND family efflux transporter MFP subunit
MLPKPFLLALPFLLAACLERAEPVVENAIRPVQAVRVALAPADETRLYAGTLRPRREADIGFRASGRIIAREVDLGARVTAGQILARLDPTDLALSVRAAEADLSGAQAQAFQANADAARSRTLLAQGWVAAAVDEAKQATARSAQEKVASATAALELARNKRDYASLRAPSDGVITAVLADPGTVIAEGQAVLRLADTASFEAEIALPEAAVAQLNDTATVTLWVRPEMALQARLREIAPMADAKLRTYTARYTIENPPSWLALGMTATVRVQRGDAAQLALLPSAALADRGQGPMVWVIDPAKGTLEARKITVKTMHQDSVLVTGLKQDELVVGLGVQKLDPAARVRVGEIRSAGS